MRVTVADLIPLVQRLIVVGRRTGSDGDAPGTAVDGDAGIGNAGGACGLDGADDVGLSESLITGATSHGANIILASRLERSMHPNDVCSVSTPQYAKPV